MGLQLLQVPRASSQEGEPGAKQGEQGQHCGHTGTRVVFLTISNVDYVDDRTKPDDLNPHISLAQDSERLNEIW